MTSHPIHVDYLMITTALSIKLVYALYDTQKQTFI